MEFPEIVSMIDADLELLYKVRQLLDPTSLPPGIAKTVKTDRKRAARIQMPMNDFPSVAAESARRTEPDPSEIAATTESEPATVTVVAQTTSSNGRLRSSRRRHNPLEASALRGTVPMGPVFVPAQPGVRTGRPTVVVHKTVVEPSPVLTAEAVARQWFSRESR